MQFSGLANGIRLRACKLCQQGAGRWRIPDGICGWTARRAHAHEITHARETGERERRSARNFQSPASGIGRVGYHTGRYSGSTVPHIRYRTLRATVIGKPTVTCPCACISTFFSYVFDRCARRESTPLPSRSMLAVYGGALLSSALAAGSANRSATARRSLECNRTRPRPETNEKHCSDIPLHPTSV